MDFEKSLADEKFWKTPELVERLISMLDPRSALRLLIQSSAVDKETLQKSLSPKAWSKLIERSSYDDEEEGLLQVEDVRDLVRLLHFLRPEEPSTFLLPLLDQICKMRPGTHFKLPGEDGLPKLPPRPSLHHR